MSDADTPEEKHNDTVVEMPGLISGEGFLSLGDGRSGQKTQASFVDGAS